jgi:ribonuclease P protein component
LTHPRVGVIVPRFKHGAVDRNRLKRRLREIIRTSLLPAIGVAAPVDVVVRVLPAAYDASFETLAAQLARTVGTIAKVGRGASKGEG